MNNSVARVQTGQASRIIKRLARHWGHKFVVVDDGEICRVELPAGPLLMSAENEVLMLRLTCPPEAQERLREVVAEHVLRMASDDSLAVIWE